MYKRNCYIEKSFLLLGILTVVCSCGQLLDGLNPFLDNKIQFSPLTLMPNAEFGSSVALSNDADLLAAGLGNSNSNSVYVFRQTGSTWMEHTIDNPGDELGFGRALAMSPDGNYLVCGLQYYNGFYLFNNISDNKWNYTVFESVETQQFSNFAVNSHGDKIIAGYARDNTNGYDTGAITAFFKTDSNWSEIKIFPENPGEYESFGSSVDMNDDGSIFVTCAMDNNEQNTIFIYSQQNTVPDFILKLDKESSYPHTSVSLSGDGKTLAVSEYSSSIYHIGSVYIYNFNGTEWVKETLPKPEKPDWSDDFSDFGKVIKLSGDGSRLIVPVNKYSSGLTYIYTKNNSGIWTMDKIEDTEPDQHAYFGTAAAISEDGTSFVVGVPGDGLGYVNLYSEN